MTERKPAVRVAEVGLRVSTSRSLATASREAVGNRGPVAGRRRHDGFGRGVAVGQVRQWLDVTEPMDIGHVEILLIKIVQQAPERRATPMAKLAAAVSGG